MSFTPFNAPVQQRPAVVKREGIDTAMDMTIVREAFQGEERLVGRLGKLAERDPTLVADISTYVLSLRRSLTSAPQTSTSQLTAVPQSKKRKLDDGSAANGSTTNAGGLWADQSQRANHVVGDVSFSIPQRKKLRLEWVSSSREGTGGVRAIGGDGGVEFGCSWADIDQILCLPVPEKTKRQHNFVILSTSPTIESIIWTVFEPSQKDLDAGANEEPSYTANLLNTELKSFRKKVVFPDENEFASAIVQSHRKEEKAFHVKAHRGAKDGYLFFLPPGILWGFKKPLLFLPFSSITSISYTSVLQRTFNLNIQATTGTEGREEEIEFSMLDQMDFAGIDEYIKRHGLNDASLATQRRAKKYGVNDAKVKKEANVNGTAATVAEMQGLEVDEEDAETELQKAERALQDEEDEMEEDYVDDDGDDDGSEDSGSDEEEYEEEGGEGGEGGGEEAFDEEEDFAEEEGGYEDEG